MQRPDRVGKVGLTFDDVLLVPRFSELRSRWDVNTGSRLSMTIKLSLPITSANMDTVTESAMAIALAKLGGLGVTHRFMSAENEVQEVVNVKRSQGVVIENPMTLRPENTMQEAWETIEQHQIGGIVVVGKDGKVQGLVTRGDITLEEDFGRRLREVMTPLRNLITAPRGVTLLEAKKILHENKVEKLPLIDKREKLTGLITSKDITKRRQFPSVTKDKKGRLRVAAAIGVKGDHMQRAKRLLDAGVDALVVDIAHGHSAHAIETVKRIKREFGDAEVVAGNVATSRGAVDLINAGADSVKVGAGAGSTCVTRVVTGFGVPQLTAIMDTAKAASEYGVPVIGDGA